jgi:4-hydroxy-3-methylbut-2-enyl diphosphate reductase
MKNIIIAEHSGFCFGVKRAVSKAYDILKKNDGKKVYILGHIIHNKNVVEELEEMGAVTVNGLEEIKDTDSYLIIRSHGVSKKILRQAENMNITVINTTCPFVSKIESYVENLLENGYSVVIIGDRNHPEVKSVIDSFDAENLFVIESADEVRNLKTKDKLGIVIQTTQSLKNFHECIDKLIDISKEIKIYNTICGATSQRQSSTLEMARKVEIIIVVGGKHSANTTRLYELCKSVVSDVYHIETEQELKKEWFENKTNIGITAGASTPSWIIDSVTDKIKSFFQE